LDLVRGEIRLKHYNLCTFDKILYLLHYKKHHVEMGKIGIELYLTKLATKDKVSQTSLNQSFSTLLFLCK